MENLSEQTALVLCLVLFLASHFAHGQTFFVRFAGGSNDSNGRVEVSRNGQDWGTVCDDKWGDQDASVVCRMRGFSRGVAVVKRDGDSAPPFGAGSGLIALDDVNCFGAEDNIAKCQHRGWGISDCTHAEDAGVQCVGTGGTPVTVSTNRPGTPGQVPDNCPGNAPSTNIRLYGQVAGIGIVEVRDVGRDQWGTICDDGFGQRDAIVVCRMLCYDVQYARAGAREDMVRATPRLPIRLDNMGCTGLENDIALCPSSGWGNENCNDTQEAVRVTCIPQNYLAPPAPLPTVSCTETQFLATFNRSSYPDIEGKHLTVLGNPSGCDPAKRTTTRLTQIAIPLGGCDTVKELNATHIIYKNTINVNSTYLHNNVYRRNTYLVHIACDFPRAGDVDDRGIQPLTESVSQRAPGQYNFKMTFYRFDNFSEPVTSFPIKLNLGEFLNVGVTLEDIDSGLKLIVPNCQASPTLDPSSSNNYPLIVDRCAPDPSLATFPWNRTAFAFRFQTIRFVGPSPVFYVTCDTFVCTIAEKNADCDQTCGVNGPSTKRRKRDARHGPMYHVGVGPFQIVTADPEGSLQSPSVIIRPVTTTSSPVRPSASPHPEPHTTGRTSSGPPVTKPTSTKGQTTHPSSTTTQSSSPTFAVPGEKQDIKPTSRRTTQRATLGVIPTSKSTTRRQPATKASSRTSLSRSQTESKTVDPGQTKSTGGSDDLHSSGSSTAGPRAETKLSPVRLQDVVGVLSGQSGLSPGTTAIFVVLATVRTILGSLL